MTSNKSRHLIKREIFKGKDQWYSGPKVERFKYGKDQRTESIKDYRGKGW